MAAGPGCLSERELRAYVLGDLTEPDSLAASAHVLACAACEAAARRLDRASDPILDGLRLAVTATTLPGAPGPEPPTIPWDEEEPRDDRGAAVATAPGGFEILGEIGRGGSGVVYLARQEHPGRLVALKMVLDGAHGSPEQRSRMLREADAIAGLRHPGIVQIHGVGRHGEIPFLTLEYVPGGNLAHRLGGAPMPPRDAAGLVEGVARAVDFAHRNGVVHRDLKPANVLLDEAGRPKVADFGLAKHGRADLTATGAILGTPSYIAPEQAAGGSRAARPSVDVYSLGAILYECLTGRPPFRAATALETIEQVRTQQPASPSVLQPGLPRDLVLVCLKCLRKEPDRRFASAGELADELRRFLDGAPLRHTRPVGSAERLALWCRRNPAWAATIAGIALLLTTVAVGASIMSLRLDRALGLARAAEADSKVRLWESYLTQARAGRDSHRRGQRTGALAAIRSALELPLPPGRSLDELRTEAIAALVLPDLEETLAWDLPDEDSRSYGVVVDTKLERYATADRNGTVEIRRLAGGLLLARLAGTGPPVNPTLSFSRSGAYFVQRCGTDARSRVWDLRGSEPALILEAPGGRRGTGRIEMTPAFDAEEQHLALVHEDGLVRIHALDPSRRNEEPRKVAEVSRRYSSMAFRPGRPHLALGSYEKTVRVVDARDGSLVASLPHPDRSTQVAWSPDGRTLATDCDDHLVRLWEVDSGTPAGPPLAGHTTGGTCPVFSGDGAYLFTNDWAASLKVWDLTTGSQILATPVGGSSFSAGGPHMFVDRPGGRLARMYRFIAPNELKTIGPTGRFAPRDRYCGAQFAPDGRLVFLTSYDRLSIVGAVGGEELATIPLSLTRVVAFDAAAAFLTSGPQGLVRWPTRAEEGGRVLRVGPPEVLDPRGDHAEPTSVALEGRVAAFQFRGLGIHLRRPGGPVTIGAREDMRSAAVSPDGRWLAGGNHENPRGIGARVWEVASGREVASLPVPGLCLVGFSPDGRWLLTTAGGYRLWRVGTWEPGPKIGPEWEGREFAFARQSRLVALSGKDREIRLVDPEVGEDLARLTVPEETRVYPVCFSSDDGRLIARGHESGLLYIWDLRALRAGLSSLGLDWNRPGYNASIPHGEKIEVRVDMGAPGALSSPGR